MEFVVRRAFRDELDEVGRLTLGSYVASGFLAEDDDYARVLLDAAARAAAGELLVAATDHGLLGTVTFCPSGTAYGEIAEDGEGEFRMLAVAEQARRRGVAEALVRTCITRSVELGYSAVVLSSLPAQVEAHRLYGRLGFRRIPEKDWSPAPGIDLLGFRLDLPPDSSASPRTPRTDD